MKSATLPSPNHSGTRAGPASPNNIAPLLLNRFLCAYWLRPENALWMTLRSLALRNAGFNKLDADFCCGDGVFTFLHFDGEFDESFDVFAATGRLSEVTRTHADMFDVATDEYAPPIMHPASTTIAIGADLKPNLLKKAAALHLYRETKQQDADEPLDFADGVFGRVYCNSAYWVKNIDLFLKELARVTRSNGRIALHVKLDAMRDYTLENLRPILGGTFLEIIGRGRLDCWPTMGSRATWEKRFAAAGLQIVAATPFATGSHAQIWDIGLRPIAPMLVRMANALEPHSRAAIKKDWVALLLELAGPLCRFDLNLLGKPGEPAEIQYVLARR